MMPCRHEYSLGVEKPTVPQDFNVSFSDTWSKCVVDVQKLELQVPDDSSQHIPDVKDLAVRNIKRFSRSRKKEEIRKCMDDNFVMSADFALGLPISVFDLISGGIQHFKS
jgi:hypothetical protein